MSAQLYRNQAGISLIEVILALALLSVVVVFLVRVEWDIDSLATSNGQVVAANNWTNVTFLRILNNIISLEPVAGLMGLTHVVTDEPFSKCESLFSAHSSWRSGWNSTTTRISTMLVPDLEQATKVGGDCFHPSVFSGDVVLVNAIHAENPVSSLDIYKGRAYVGLSSLPLETSLMLLPLTAGSATETVVTESGINKIDVGSDGIFAAQQSNTAQVFSSAYSGGPITTFATSTLPGVAGQRPEAVSISYYDHKLFIGTKRTAGQEFHMFDVRDPTAPVWLGSREVNHNINDIEVRGNYAFLATSGNIRDLIVLDISHSTLITQAAAIDLPGNEDGKSVFVAGNLIFLGRYKSTVSGRYELNVLEATFDENGLLISVDPVVTAATGGDINDLVYAGGYVYVATSNPQKEFQIFKFDSENKTLALVKSFDLNANATALDVEGNMVAVGAGTDVYVYKIHE